jgi:hypothetical protein
MGKTVAILQSNYIPWKGYFDLIHMVDEFILYDDMQYTRRDWRNRNLIKTPAGTAWLTIPVEVKGKYYQKINETRISEPGWAEKHWQTICHSYARAPFFRSYRPLLEELYRGATQPLLSEVNYHFLRAICDLLQIRTRISWSMDYRLEEGKTERLVALCRQAGATAYISGPAAQRYIAPELFEQAGIELRWMDYAGYPEYPQLHPPFEHGVSIIDLILSVGEDARSYMKSF